jgi:hypothetical protein
VSPLLALSAAGWTVRTVIAVIAMLAIYLLGAGMLRKFKISPDEEPNPDQVVSVNARFRCIVCGAEVTMTAAQDADELDAPRHCREDMVPIGPIGPVT